MCMYPERKKEEEKGLTLPRDYNSGGAQTGKAYNGSRYRGAEGGNIRREKRADARVQNRRLAAASLFIFGSVCMSGGGGQRDDSA